MGNVGPAFLASGASVILAGVKPGSPALRLSPARAAAFDVLLRVECEASYASELLHSRTCAGLTALDHALATELVMGVLRWRSLLDSEIAAYSAQPLARLDLEVLSALRLGAYQLQWLTRIPARASIHESVELVKRARKRSAAAFVNAVLRKFAAAVPRGKTGTVNTIGGASPEGLAATSAHPAWLVERWAKAYGPEAAFHICRHNQSVPVTTIRLRHPDAEARLRSEGVELAPGALLSSARRVVAGDIVRTSVFKDGLCIIQDEASQLVAALVGRGPRILDCCAAPGGKTAAIADINPQTQLVAVELHPHRARLLQRLIGWRHRGDENESAQVSVVAADARNLPFTAKFDRVLADVPCSGTGTLSRNPEIKWRLAQEDLGDLQVRQAGILRSAMARVSAGGRVIYSTCSLEKEENEEVVERCLSSDSSFRMIDCRAELARLKEEGKVTWQDIASLAHGPYLRTLPGVHPCDGFFAAILQAVS